MRLRRLREDLPSRPDLQEVGDGHADRDVDRSGVTVTDFLLSFWVGVAYVLVSAWAIPTAVRKFL